MRRILDLELLPGLGELAEIGDRRRLSGRARQSSGGVRSLREAARRDGFRDLEGDGDALELRLNGCELRPQRVALLQQLLVALAKAAMFSLGPEVKITEGRGGAERPADFRRTGSGGHRRDDWAADDGCDESVRPR
jgi:hypothetical protein